MNLEVERQSWTEAEPGLVESEKEAMSVVAPEMIWKDELVYFQRPVVGWQGTVPDWTAERPKPDGVDRLLDGRRLQLLVLYPEAFPMVPPALVPVQPEIPIAHRTMNKWHVMGDGSLCLIQAAEDWQPENTAADLIRKAAGWFIEYLLLDAGRIEQMTQRGIYEDDCFDKEIGRTA